MRPKDLSLGKKLSRIARIMHHISLIERLLPVDMEEAKRMADFM